MIYKILQHNDGRNIIAVATLKIATEELGLSLDDSVKYYIKGDKGVIEVSLDGSDNEIELSAVNDTSEDFLTEYELRRCLNLKDI